MSAPLFTPTHRELCAICAVETQWGHYHGEKPWCQDCGHNEDTLAPQDNPGGCDEHPNATHEVGFGLAGGGYGAYCVCNECGSVFGKVQEMDEQ